MITASFRDGMNPKEYARLAQLLLEVKPTSTLEIGMALAGSSSVICSYLRDHPNECGRKHVAIDPFQMTDEYRGAGVETLRAAGLEQYCEILLEYNYIALPQLVKAGRSFDFILIDGWHSFDYTIVDLFYADLLVRPGGVIAIHDTDLPSVCKACMFLETHKPYERLSPPLAVNLPSFWSRGMRRVRQSLAGPQSLAETRSRRTEWLRLSAYRKRENSQVPNTFYREF